MDEARDIKGGRNITKGKKGRKEARGTKEGMKEGKKEEREKEKEKEREREREREREIKMIKERKKEYKKKRYYGYHWKCEMNKKAKNNFFSLTVGFGRP